MERRTGNDGSEGGDYRGKWSGSDGAAALRAAGVCLRRAAVIVEAGDRSSDRQTGGKQNHH